MKLKIQVLQRVILESLGLRAGIEDHNDCSCASIAQLHHDQSRNLTRPGVEELQVGLDFGERSHAEKDRRLAYAQQILKPLPAARDLSRSRTDCGVCQQWLLNRPIRPVVGLNG